MHLRGGVGKTEVSFDKPSAETLESLDVESGVGELLSTDSEIAACNTSI